MVRKLIKYDFMSYLRLLLPVQLILIGIAAINRIVQFFEPNEAVSGALGYYSYGSLSSSNGYSTVFGSSIALYIISIIVCMLMTIIVSIVRFYQGMYTNEGYLNHTLPVTSSQHIFAKLLTSMIFTLGSLFAVFVSFMVITAGDMNYELFKAFFYLMGKLFKVYGGHAVLYIIEAIILVVIYCAFVYLKLYFCISVGQLAKKKKVLLAFGVFFGIYVIKQIIGTVLIAMLTTTPFLFQDIVEWFSDKPTTAIHIVMCSLILFYALLSLIYFLITKYIMSKKLNLT